MHREVGVAGIIKYESDNYKKYICFYMSQVE